MLERPGFTITTVAEGENYGRYRVEPLEPGYGTTLGNALRRILLRSLDGVAISRVRIDGVWHEFSTVRDVREDVTELVLNLKKIRLRRVMELEGDVRAHLYVRGDGSGDRVVTAGDVAWPTEVDVINPEQAIATLTAPDAVLDVDLWVNRGRGYREAELQETFALGEIPIDAIYTPIQKVNYVVEHTRVGQQTDYDSLIIEILTDGTIEPDDALSEAAQILVDHAKVFAEFNRAPAAAEAATGPSIPEEVQNTRLTDLGLSPRVTNALRSRGIETVGQVLSIDADTLMSIRNFGPRSLNELRDKLIEYGYWPEDTQLAESVDTETEDEDIDDMAAALRALQERGIGGDLDDEE
ncbi:MAG: DNA-directed RNA polymerase subunit alpha [Thermomicrobiales bacterium]|nr:DNA-directed RNA polymerase subunit alpha [Thermomicrobiales bacterium]